MGSTVEQCRGMVALLFVSLLSEREREVERARERGMQRQRQRQRHCDREV